MRKNILYVGESIGKENSAMNIHVVNIGKLLLLAGYNVIYCCKSDYITDSIKTIEEFSFYYTKLWSNNIIYRKIYSFIEVVSGWSLFKLVEQLCDEFYPDVILYYGTNVESKLIHLCKIKNIKLVLDKVDWFEKDDRKGIFNQYYVQKKIDKSFYDLDLYANGVIAISDYIFEFFKSKNVKTIKIPPIFKQYNTVFFVESIQPVKLIYCGTLGGNKDTITPIIDALQKINCTENLVTLDVVGVTLEDYRQIVKNDYLSEEEAFKGVFFHGRIPHEDALVMLQNSHFSVLLRENKRYAKAGFSTKFAESMMMAVPVICNKVGGADKCITDGVNGFLIENNSVQKVVDVLERILLLNQNEIMCMKKRTVNYASKYFYIDNYKNEIRNFIETL